jgi:hypothetical protein
LTLVAACLLAALFLRLGGVVARWANPPGRRGPAPWEADALSALLGFALVGTAFFGLGLAGLFFRPVLLGAVAVGAACPRCRLRPAAVRAAWGSRPPWAAAALAPAAVTLALACVPTIYVDVYSYHLVAPELFLKVHRFTLDHVTMGLHCPLTAELVYAFGVMADRDALPQLLQLVPFAGAVLLLAGWAGRLGGPTAGWLAATGVLTLGMFEQQAVLAKNSLAGAAYPVAGAVCALMAFGGRGRRRWLVTAAILFGCGMATKWNGFPLAAVAGLAVLAGLRSRRGPVIGPWMAWAAIAGLVTAPWLIKAWLWTGDPVWPLLAARLPGALWEPESTAAMTIVRGGLPWSGWLAGLLPGFTSFWWASHPAILLAAPVLLVAGPPRIRTLAAWAAAGWVALWWLMPGDAPRLALPVWMLLVAAVAVAAAAWWEAGTPRARRIGMGAWLVGVWLPLGPALDGFVDPALAVRFLAGNLDQAGFQASAQGTYPEAAADLGRQPGLRGVMVLGEDRFYRLPGRPVAGRFYGRTWAWAAARECATRDRIRVRARQADVTHVLYNFVTDQFPRGYTAAYTWDDRALGAWTEFVRRDLEIVQPPRHVEHAGGGFCIYRLRRGPLAHPPDWLAYLPGIPGLYDGVTRYSNYRDIAKYREAAMRLAVRCPRVDNIANLVASSYKVERRWGEAWRSFAPGIAHGTIGDGNYYEAGIAAAMLGREKEAFVLIRRAIEISPYLGPQAEAILTSITRAGQARQGGRATP